LKRPPARFAGDIDGRNGPRLSASANSLSTFSFLIFLYFAAFSVISVRERRWFWATMPSKTVMISVAGETVVGTLLTRVGLPGLTPLPWPQMVAIFACAMVSCLAVNDAVKVAMIKRRANAALA
jgi:hypothetical protein